ncbi:HTH DNA binding domain-containing protein [Halobiforma haloterrestris]|uniref:HTH DNA binding domain-containing protein n=1 Tax=Natronobacterium haloterrestre TaxID=148448 RepID=A0A1I1JH87_NATHA|nr:helix-turn-helix domain-containing protein [Halobiforma haloterrestris]SFC45313.1 HTH DNA binding domain-containing protein [Halobiforma haloterrestris]
MRYATVVLTWPDEHLTGIDEAFAAREGVSLEAIRHLNPIDADDGRHAELLEMRGDLERARTALADAPEVLEYDVAGDDGHGAAYVRCRTVPPVDDLLAVPREYEVVIDWPLPFVAAGGSDSRGNADRGLEVTLVGPGRALRRATRTLPAGVEFDLRRTGAYEAESLRSGSADSLSRSVRLTDRQRELFAVARSEGYYEVPRRTTHRELADRLGLSPGTVGEHLQRIEAKLAAAYGSSMR